MTHRTKITTALWCMALLAAPAITAMAAAKTAPNPSVSVDPRVELVSIVFYLSGGPDYVQPSQYRPYREAVDRWFSRFSDHPAVRYARKLRERDGIGFDAPMALAIRISPDPSLRLLVPLEPWPQHLDKRWRPATVRKFLKRLRKFRRDSNFDAFFREQQPLYQEVTKRLRHTVRTGLHLEWFPAFFGASGQQGGSLHIVAGMLLGGCNYGPSAVIGGRLQRYAIVGVYRTGADGQPTFQADDMPTVVHELCHTYSNPVVDRWIPRMMPALTELYHRHEKAFRSQAYGGPEDVAYESMVRACVGRYLLDTVGEKAARAHEQEQTKLEFLWVGNLMRLLGTYELNRKQYPDLDSFMPRVVTFFKNWVATHPAPAAPGRAHP